MKQNGRDSMNPSWMVSALVLVACFTATHLFFEGVVRPNAEAALAAGGTSAMLNVYVVFKDLEQQLCISAALYCVFLIIYKLIALVGEEDFYTRDFLEGTLVDGEDNNQRIDVDAALNQLQGSQYQDNSAIATWISCLRRYKNTLNVQHASDAIASSVDALAMQLESGNNMIRYIIWAIPSIGFVGTVRGIGQALAKADEALAGDIAGMTASLGVAFNSTFVALLLSLILMFLLNLLQSRQDNMVINTQKSCESNLLAHLHQ
ncbi:MotA/TolQ/ExbB proton channel family protein [Gammaproteobacteria bacterium]|nr:MotA/TolQ/ExbB proton channel family protein [Gammaproteobacteria bacterium]